eukprot:7352580-Lingulodinium_polyedra.AAC.1
MLTSTLAATVGSCSGRASWAARVAAGQRAGGGPACAVARDASRSGPGSAAASPGVAAAVQAQARATLSSKSGRQCAVEGAGEPSRPAAAAVQQLSASSFQGWPECP